NALGRTGDDQVESQALFAQFLAHGPRRFLAATIERPVEIAEAGLVPVRLGMAKNSEPLHVATSVSRIGTVPARRRSTRPIASSSGTRDTCTVDGKARNSRDGMAADRMTNVPQSPWRRISRPNACASRARTTRSS